MIVLPSTGETRVGFSGVAQVTMSVGVAVGVGVTVGVDVFTAIDVESAYLQELWLMLGQVVNH